MIRYEGEVCIDSYEVESGLMELRSLNVRDVAATKAFGEELDLLGKWDETSVLECLLVYVKRKGQLVDVHSRGDVGIDHHDGVSMPTVWQEGRLDSLCANPSFIIHK